MSSQESEQVKNFQIACEQIGKIFADHGHVFIVGTDDPLDADRHVVIGVTKARGQHSVIVSRPENDTRQKPFEGEGASEFQKITFNRVRRKQGWTSTLLHALSEADILLVIGGQAGTRATGYVAEVLSKPVLAIPSFGGAAKEVWDEVKNYYSKSKIDSNMKSALLDPWTEKTAEVALRSAEALVRQTPFPRSGVKMEVLLFALVVGLLVTWVLLNRSVGTDRYPAFFFQMLVAAMLGTLLRNAMRLVVDSAAALDVRLLFREAITGMIVGFGLFLFYLGGGLVIVGGFVPLASDADFNRVSITMSIIGLGAGLLLRESIALLEERLKRHLEPKDSKDTGG